MVRLWICVCLNPGSFWRVFLSSSFFNLSVHLCLLPVFSLLVSCLILMSHVLSRFMFCWRTFPHSLFYLFVFKSVWSFVPLSVRCHGWFLCFPSACWCHLWHLDSRLLPTILPIAFSDNLPSLSSLSNVLCSGCASCLHVGQTFYREIRPSCDSSRQREESVKTIYTIGQETT